MIAQKVSIAYFGIVLAFERRVFILEVLTTGQQSLQVFFWSKMSIVLNSHIRARGVVSTLKQRFAIPQITHWLAMPSHHPDHGCRFLGLASRAAGFDSVSLYG
jgi:hypothetical protein